MPTPKPRIGYAAGVFDMFHIGHLNLLTRARGSCDSLIVGVTTDALAEQRKERPPIIPEHDRMAIVAALRCVDRVVPQTSMDKLAAHAALGFDHFDSAGLLVPIDAHAGAVDHAAGCFGNFRTNPVAGDQGDFVAHS